MSYRTLSISDIIHGGGGECLQEKRRSVLRWSIPPHHAFPFALFLKRNTKKDDEEVLPSEEATTKASTRLEMYYWIHLLVDVPSDAPS